MAYGTLSIPDLQAATNQSVAAFGEDRTFGALQANLDAYNGIVREMVAEIAEPTTDRLRRYGGVSRMEMVPADEYGRANAQKVTTGQNIGFPMDNYQIAVQWTRKYFQMHTPAELAGQYLAMREADSQRILAELQRAIYTPTNRLTYVDRFVDNVALPVRALANATAGDTLPVGPSGTAFDGATHTHYLASATLTPAALSALITTVREHAITGQVRLYISATNEAAVRAMTTNFTAYLDARIVPAQNTQQATATLDVNDATNRPIGIFDTAEVWVKPWVLANYPVAIRMGGPTMPLVFRTRDGGALADLQMVSDWDQFPLRAQHFEREFGIGVFGRVDAAVLQANNAVYTAPVIA